MDMVLMNKNLNGNSNLEGILRVIILDEDNIYRFV